MITRFDGTYKHKNIYIVLSFVFGVHWLKLLNLHLTFVIVLQALNLSEVSSS